MQGLNMSQLRSSATYLHTSTCGYIPHVSTHIYYVCRMDVVLQHVCRIHVVLQRVTDLHIYIHLHEDICSLCSYIHQLCTWNVCRVATRDYVCRIHVVLQCVTDLHIYIHLHEDIYSLCIYTHLLCMSKVWRMYVVLQHVFTIHAVLQRAADLHIYIHLHEDIYSLCIYIHLLCMYNLRSVATCTKYLDTYTIHFRYIHKHVYLRYLLFLYILHVATLCLQNILIPTQYILDTYTNTYI